MDARVQDAEEGIVRAGEDDECLFGTNECYVPAEEHELRRLSHRDETVVL
jgi:hypothetical protein